jgi:putative hydroxymethylpyrimidine transport system substrate-binding protein
MLKKLIAGAALALLMSAQAHAADKLTVLLDWYLNPDHAPLIVAEQIGAFKDEGLDVELVPPADPSMPPRLVASGQADIAVSYQPQLYLYADQGLPLVRIGTLVNTPLNTVLSLKKNGISSMADFKGKKMGYSVSGVEEATLTTMLATGGLKLSDITMVNVNFQLVSALMAGQVDGVIGGYRNVEANELTEHGVEPMVMKVEDYGVPAYDELIFLVNKDHADDPRFKKFLAAVKKGTDYLIAHSEDTWTAFAKTHPDLDNALNKAIWAQTIPMFAKDPGMLDKARYQAYGKFLADNKLIAKELPVGDYATELK